MPLSNIFSRVQQMRLSWKLPVFCPEFVSNREVIFIGGCGRSGTTLLRSLLQVSKDLIGGPELNIHTNLLSTFSRYPILPKVSFLLFDEEVLQEISEKFEIPKEEFVRIRDVSKCLPDFLDRFFGLLLLRSGRRKVMEKTPKNVTILPFLLSSFPNAKFIHVIRDGRDVVCSLRNHPAFVSKNGELVPSGIVNSIPKCTKRWIRDVSAGLLFRKNPRYFEVFYEKLVESPEEELKKICRFVDIEFTPHMLKKKSTTSGDEKYSKVSANAKEEIESSRRGRWKKDLSKEEAEGFEKIAGTLLQELGYEKNSSWLEFYNERKQEN